MPIYNGNTCILLCMTPPEAFGAITYPKTNRRSDFLYRVSLKCLVKNDKGEVLVVQETPRDWWDLPGGGMDHGESIQAAIAREMKEEVAMHGDFTYSVIDVDEPAVLPRNIWQLRLVFEVAPLYLEFRPGDDSSEIAFINPQLFKNASNQVERRIYRYAQKANLL